MKLIFAKTSFILILLLLTISCTKMAMMSDVRFYDKARIQYISDGDKTVAYIPMMHMNKPEFYESVKLSVDSLRDAGYTVLYEGIDIAHSIDSLVMDTLNRKVRRVIGMHMSDYNDTDNVAMKKFQLKGLIPQSNENTGIVTATDIRADLPLDTLVQIYEQNRGMIALTNCDFTTPLNSKYKCAQLGNEDAVFLVLTIRDQLVAKRILFEETGKIAVVYGALHFDGIFNELRARNNNWKRVEYN